MPLNDDLLKCWTNALKEYAMLNMNLDDDDPMKFSRSTPKRLSLSTCRLWDGGSPSSDYIAHDIRKVSCKNVPIVKDKMLINAKLRQ